MTSRLCSITTTVLPWLDQAVEHFEQLADVLEMEAGGRLVEDVERLAGGAPRQLLRQLDALRLAAAERRRRLADLDVAEADLLQHAHLVADAGDRLEEARPRPRRHVEHVGDRVALELHLQRLAVVAGAVAHVAGDVDVGQEVHLDLDQAVALARLAAAALDVEARSGRACSRAPWLSGRPANQSRIWVKAPV